MSSIRETAQRFFDACETGKGWEGTQQYCHADATFSAQAGALEGIDTLQAYPDWMKGLLGFMPDPFGLPDTLTVDQMLEFYAIAYRVPIRDRRSRIERAVGPSPIKRSS